MIRRLLKARCKGLRKDLKDSAANTLIEMVYQAAQEEIVFTNQICLVGAEVSARDQGGDRLEG